MLEFQSFWKGKKRLYFFYFFIFFESFEIHIKKQVGPSQLTLVSLFVSLAIYLDNLCQLMYLPYETMTTVGINRSI